MRGGQDVVILPGYDEWLKAFWELSTERQLGMSVGPIPSSAISRWVIEKNLGSEAGLFRSCIRAMDNVYLNHISKGKDAPAIRSEPLDVSRFDRMF